MKSKKPTSATVIPLPAANRQPRNIAGRKGRIIKTFIPRKISRMVKEWFSGIDMEKYRIKATPDIDTINELTYIARLHGVPVYFRDFPLFLKQARIDGLCWRLPNRKRVILVDDALKEEDKKFVLAHETYHSFAPSWVTLEIAYKTESKEILERYRQQEQKTNEWATMFLYLGGVPKSKHAVELDPSDKIWLNS